MTGIILAAGVGKRMGVNALPKCLLAVDGRSLLQRTMEALRTVGVRRVVVVVGYRQDEVAAEAKRHAGSMELVIIENLRYREGAILSLWSARDTFGDDLLIMDADVLFPPVFLNRLVGSYHENCVLVDGSSPDTGEEQVVLGQEARVLHITKRPPKELKESMTPFGESVGFLRLSREAAGVLYGLLDAKVRAGIVDIEHEQVYPDLFTRVEVGYEPVDDLSWTEIDTPEDLQRAEREVLPKWKSTPCVNRVISNVFLPFVLKLPVTPNQWTFISMLLGLASIQRIAQGDRESLLWAALLFQLFYVVDNWDGDVARAKGLSSRWGGWFDVSVDALVQISLPLAIAVGLRRFGAQEWVIGFGLLTAAGIALDFLVTGFAKIRGFGPSIHGDPDRHGAQGGPSVGGWIRTNLTNENFSLIVLVVLLLDLRQLFLIVSAVGSHLFWLNYLWKERKRLFRPITA